MFRGRRRWRRLGGVPDTPRERARAFLAPLVAVSATGALLCADLLAELYWHRSTVLALLGGLIAVAPAVWLSRFDAGGWTPRARRTAAVRVVALLAALVAALVLFDRHHNDGTAWALWVPLMTLDIVPVIARALPKLTAAFVVGLLAIDAFVVARYRRFAFLAFGTWTGLWLAIAFTGFYRTWFDSFDAGAVTSQPGVTLLAVNHDTSCPIFARACSTRLFPRNLAVDEKSRTIFAAYGATARAIQAGQPTLLAVDMGSGKTQWLPGTNSANQLRDLTLDPAQRLLAFSQWGSRLVSVYDADRRVRTHAIPYRLFPHDDYVPASVLIDGDRVIVTQIWYPRIDVYSLRDDHRQAAVDLYDKGAVGLGVQIGTAVMSRARRRLWVTLGHLGDNILELDLDSLSIRRGIRLDAKFPSSLSYDDSRGRLYATSFHGSEIEVVDVASMKRVDVLEGVAGSRATLPDPARDVLYVSDYSRGEVLFVSLSAHRVMRVVQVGPKPGGLALAGGALYANTALGIARIQLD